jgi:hypothetical protein
MNRTDINKFLTNPKLVDDTTSNELRRLIEIYPYCEVLYWIYLRSLYIKDDATFDDELLKYGMHISNRRLFFNYLTTDNSQTNETQTNNKQTDIETNNTPNSSLLIPHLSTPDYFALEQNQAHKQSLQQLAEQLKKARLARQTQNSTIKTENNESNETIDTTKQNNPINKENNTTQKPNTPPQKQQITEDDAKKLIKEQKYLEAIEILRAISLNNPKKSANFALQIKFLETIINNHNKN